MTLTPNSDILKVEGSDNGSSCPHTYKKWDRIGDKLFHVCRECGEIVSRDTVTTHATISADSLGNQVDPAEGWAWLSEFRSSR